VPYYQDDTCIIYCADCREVLPFVKADAVIMDPPYNFSQSSSGTKHSFYADAINSAVWFEDILKKCVATFPYHGGTLWQFLNWKTMVSFQKALFDSELETASLVVWDKCWIGPGGTRGLRPSYELVALVLTGEACIEDRSIPDIWRHQWASQRPYGHPAEKPLDLLKQLCSITTAQTILDPFMGSGTTLAAAKDLGRKAIGIEIEEKYCAIAVERLRQEVLPL
jgi:DNA modification methylase